MAPRAGRQITRDTWTWRREIAPVICQTIEEGKSQGMAGPELEAFVRRNAWRWGARSLWPYKVWLDEVRRQLKLPRHPRRPTPPTPLFDALEGGDP